MLCCVAGAGALSSGSEQILRATTVLAVVLAFPHVQARQRRRSLSGHAEARQSGNNGCGSTSRGHGETWGCKKSVADAGQTMMPTNRSNTAHRIMSKQARRSNDTCAIGPCFFTHTGLLGNQAALPAQRWQSEAPLQARIRRLQWLRLCCPRLSSDKAPRSEELRSAVAMWRCTRNRSATLPRRCARSLRGGRRS